MATAAARRKEGKTDRPFGLRPHLRRGGAEEKNVDTGITENRGGIRR
jgi:hypothetical protein